jgi:hypothetical protein
MVRKLPQIGYEKYATFLDFILGFPVLGKRDDPKPLVRTIYIPPFRKVRGGWGTRSSVVGLNEYN